MTDAAPSSTEPQAPEVAPAGESSTIVTDSNTTPVASSPAITSATDTTAATAAVGSSSSTESTSASGTEGNIAPIAPASSGCEAKFGADTAAPGASADAIDPSAPHVPAPVTHESLLTELVAVVKRDARGISHHLEALIEKAEKHFGL